MKSVEEKRKSIIITLLCCAVVFVVVFAIVNFVSIAAVFSFLMTLFSPILIGFAIAYMLNPILRLFEFKVYKKITKKNINRALSIVSTYIVAILIVVALLFLLLPSIIDAIVDLVTNYDGYIIRTSDLINNIINKFLENDTAKQYVNEQAISNAIARFFSASGTVIETIMQYIEQYAAGLVTGVKNAILGIFISIYVLISKEKLQAQARKFMSAVLPDKKNRRLSKYLTLTYRTFSGYFVGKITGAILVFLLLFFLLLIFRVPYAPLVATIIGITDIIPVFGPILGAIPSFFIIFIADPGKAIVFLVLLILVQQLEGNVISPKILGEATGISSLSVIIAIVIMGDCFGFVGMIIGVPVFAVGITVMKEVIETRLKKKGKSIDTADYYLKDSAVDPHDEHIPFGRKMFNNAKELVSGIKKKLTKNQAADEQVEQTQELKEEQEQQQEQEGENGENGEQS